MKKQIALLIALATASSSVLTAGPVESNKDVTPVQTQPVESPWSFSLTPYAWMSGVDGTIAAGDRTADVNIGFDDIVKKLDMGFAMAMELRYKRWSFLGDLIYARLHNDSAPPAGIVFSSTHTVVKETIGTMALSYRVVDSKATYLDVFAGGRVYDFYAQIRLYPNIGQQGVDVDGTQNWVDPILGVRGRYYISRAVFLNGYGDIGGFGVGSEFTWQAFGAIGIQAARWCDVELGYRALGFEYDSGRTRQDLITHGPIIGAVIHF